MYPKLSKLKLSAQNSDPKNLKDFVIVLQNDKVKVRIKFCKCIFTKLSRSKKNFRSS